MQTPSKSGKIQFLVPKDVQCSEINAEIICQFIVLTKFSLLVLGLIDILMKNLVLLDFRSISDLHKFQKILIKISFLRYRG